MNEARGEQEVDANLNQSGSEVDSFVFYRSFYVALNSLRSGAKLALYDAICEYALNGNISKLPKAAEGCFALILPQLQANLRRREVGKFGGRPPKNKPMVSENKNHRFSETETNGYETEKPNANVNANANANVNVNGEGFPTLTEVEAYARAEGIQTNCKGFYDYYNTPDSSGRRWADMQGNPVNWKRKLRTWATLDKAVATARTKPAKNRNTLLNYNEENEPVTEIDLDLEEL